MERIDSSSVKISEDSSTSLDQQRLQGSGGKRGYTIDSIDQLKSYCRERQFKCG